LRSTSRFPRGLDCRKEQRDKYADDGNHHEKLNKRETSTFSD
jgi:hypothetical protein